MKRKLLLVLAVFSFLGNFNSAAQINVTVSGSATWLGYANVCKSSAKSVLI